MSYLYTQSKVTPLVSHRRNVPGVYLPRHDLHLTLTLPDPDALVTAAAQVRVQVVRMRSTRVRVHVISFPD